MKVYIGKYPKWIGPYQIAEKILFWKDKNSDAVWNLGRLLAGHNKEEDNTSDKKLWTVKEVIEDLKEDKCNWLSNLCEWIYSKRKRNVKVKIDPWDAWNCDTTLSYIIHPLLKELKKRKNSYGAIDKKDVPEYLHGTYGSEGIGTSFSKEAYEWVLDEIIWATQDFDDYECNTEEFHKRRENAMKLFGKYYFTFWD